MTNTDRRWPDAAQRLALRAAVGSPDDAAAAWAELTGRVDLAELWDAEIYRLLPLVWKNLGPAVGPDQEARLKGLYRKTWVHNQHLLRAAAEAIDTLSGAGIDSLVLKGVPLTVAYYGDVGARPMGDVDLLVRPEQAVAAFRILESQGYDTVSIRSPDASRWEREGDDGWYRRLRHARAYSRGPLDGIDLHWTLSLDFVGDDDVVAGVDDLFDDALPVTIEGVEARTLSSTHHLLHTIVHGLGASEHNVLRWIPDALTILGTGPDVDGDELAAVAVRHHCNLMVAEGLAYLVTEWDAPVPPSARARLAMAPVDPRQRALRWIRRNVGRRAIGTGYAAGLFVTSTTGLGPVATAIRIPGFLADHWHVDRLAHVPLVLGHKIRARSTLAGG